MGPAPFVVAVSGASGAGKTTVVTGLAAALRSAGRPAAVLHFDDYADGTHMPADLVDWLARGADPEEWRTPRFSADLAARLETAAPGTVVVVEEPFGRARTPLRTLVDLAIHLDLPLGVALARRLLRDFVPEAGGVPEPSADRLRRYLAHYLRGGGATYAAVDRIARAASDVTLDGLVPPSELVERAWQEVRGRLAARPERQWNGGK